MNPPPFYVHERAGVEDCPSYAPSTPGGHAAACPYGGMDGRLVGKHNRECAARLRKSHASPLTGRTALLVASVPGEP